MAKGDNLDEFEILNLAAVFKLGTEAYVMTIHEMVEKLAEGDGTVSIGSCYTTLDRLEQKAMSSHAFLFQRRTVEPDLSDISRSLVRVKGF